MTDTHTRPARADDDIRVSFEVFPPMSDAGQEKLLAVARDLEKLSPDFFSVTYGAGGSTRQRTLETLEQIGAATALDLAGHLTCVDATRRQTDDVARRYLDAGIRRIVALRGDSRSKDGSFSPHPDGYKNATDLVAGLRQVGDFDISVAAYPEMHPQSANRQADLDNLKAKIDAGADRAITQFFFDTRLYVDFIGAVRGHGIEVPVIPGIILIHDFAKVKRFSAMCGASVPKWLEDRFAGVEAGSSQHHRIAVDTAVQQVRELAQNGVRHFHFYTMNRSDLALDVCRKTGIGGIGGKEAMASVA